VNRFPERLASLGIVCPVERKGARHVYPLYVVRTGKRDALQRFLKKRGMDTLIHYPIPIHQQKAFKEWGYRRGDVPLTEQYSRTILSLPFFPEIKESEMEEVARGIQHFMEAVSVPKRLSPGRGND